MNKIIINLKLLLLYLKIFYVIRRYLPTSYYNTSAEFLVFKMLYCFIVPDSDAWCPGEFDGWTCINRTKAGEVAKFPCPYFILGFDTKRTYTVHYP